MKKAKKGYTLKKKPRKYQATEQQRTIQAASEFCEIKKGMTKAELMEKMANCIPQYFKDNRKEPVDVEAKG
jgi:hypothetical protein